MAIIKKNPIVFLAVFFVFLLYFVWNASWHLPSQLIIKGRVDFPAEVRVSWDSGAGFNDMEATDLVFGKPAEVSSGSGIVSIRRIGKRHPAAKSADVWIKVIKRSKDENPMRLGRFASQEGVEVTADGYLHLKKDDVMLTVPVGKDGATIVFAMNEFSGAVEIDRDGDRRLYDLYAEQPQDKWVECGKEIFTPGEFYRESEFATL